MENSDLHMSIAYKINLLLENILKINVKSDNFFKTGKVMGDASCLAAFKSNFEKKFVMFIMDIMGPLSTSLIGKTYVLVVVDHLTRYVLLLALEN